MLRDMLAGMPIAGLVVSPAIGTADGNRMATVNLSADVSYSRAGSAERATGPTRRLRTIPATLLHTGSALALIAARN